MDDRHTVTVKGNLLVLKDPLSGKEVFVLQVGVGRKAKFITGKGIDELGKALHRI